MCLIFTSATCGNEDSSTASNSSEFEISMDSDTLPNRPFKSLKSNDIESAEVSVFACSRDKSADLSSGMIEEMVGILNESRTYLEDETYRECDGGVVIFNLKMTDGKENTIMEDNGTMVINGRGVTGEYHNLEELTQLAYNAVGFEYY